MLSIWTCLKICCLVKSSLVICKLLEVLKSMKYFVRSKVSPVPPNNFNDYVLLKTLFEQPKFKVPIAPNYKGVCLQNTSKPHSYYLKIW